MADEDVLETLKKKRSVIRQLTTKLITKIENIFETETNSSFSNEQKVEELNDCLNQLADKSDVLKDLDSKIEIKISLEDLETEITQSQEYVEKIVKYKGKIDRFLKLSNIKVFSQEQNEIRSKSPSLSKHSELNHTENHNVVKLPKLEISKFFGDPSQFTDFWSQFDTAINKNSLLNKIDKFNYLKMYLGRQALQAISGFALTAENYDSSIKLLNERYGRQDLIISSHMKKLLTLDPVKDPSNVKALRRLYDFCAIQIRSLQALNVTAGSYGSLLCPVIFQKLPEEIGLEYNRQRRTKSEFDIEELLNFLRQEVEVRESSILLTDTHCRTFSRDSKLSEQKHPGNFPRRQNTTQIMKNKNVLQTAAELIVTQQEPQKNKISCVFCEDSHPSKTCKYAFGLSFEERRTILLKRGICFRCLIKGRHLAKDCKTKVFCENCGSNKHFNIMCFSHRKEGNKSDFTPKNTNDSDTVLTNNSFPSKEVLLQTLIVCVRNNDKSHFIRIILDSASQKSYITKFAAEKLNLKPIGEEIISHSLFGGYQNTEKHKKYLVNLSNINMKFSLELEVLDQKQICTVIPRLKNGKCTQEIRKRGIFISDISLNDNCCLYNEDPDEVQMLLGADYIGKLFTGEIQHLGNNLTAFNTHFGWVVTGKTTEFVSDYKVKNSTTTVLTLHVKDAKLTDLWSLDTLGILDTSERLSRAEIDEITREHFLRTVKRLDDGRYKVSLPWIEGHPMLPNYRNIAERRLKGCIKSLQSKGKMHLYEEVFNEWEKENIIEQIHSSSEEKSGEHFLPHRAVFKESSTTKIRPVFDGSTREKNSPSINDCLEKGPNLVELIPTIITRFRIGKIGVVADIKKAFLQIELDERDRSFLKFLWWEGGDMEKLKIYQHRRVVFGLSSSPYLLGATLEYHLKNISGRLQETASKLLKAFYVDNCVTSLENEEDLQKFISESKEILSLAKFELRGWEHNCHHSANKEFVSAEEERIVPVLGLNWNISVDSLSVELGNIVQSDLPVTKRKILSTVHKVFDPLGFTCPVTLGPKVLLQECWKLQTNWDTELPDSIARKFERWKQQLNILKELSIPRCIVPNFESTELSLHIFCDASKAAYATCIFLRSESDNLTSCQLVQARSKVAPLKSITIPRLELMACLIGVRLAQNVKTDLGIDEISTYFWTDSANALCWIKSHEHWAPFVYNRVQEIRQYSRPEQWCFVPGHLNPADLPSRGCTAEALMKSRWWEGPPWLKNSKDEWPKSEYTPDFEIVNTEKRKSIVSAINLDNRVQRLYNRISSYNKMLRVIGWIFRFFRNSKLNRSNRIYGDLNNEEIKQAEISLIKLVQEETFSGQEDNRLKGFQTQIDSNGLLRITSRIVRRQDFENFRYPIILPPEHPVVEKLIYEKHVSLGHAGVQHLMSSLREDYWVLKYRKTVKKIVRNCTHCKKFDSRRLEMPTAPLPEDRIREAAVFEVVGIDYAGPLILKGGQKSWVLLFTCAIFRTVHLELVTSLTTEKFLQTLRRFIARRGRPSIIYSDNGTSFTGAENVLRKIDWNLVQKYGTVNKITWKFIPPSAPWWGGWWERLIGIMKRILRKVLGKSSLDYDEMSTTLCDCESFINNRPLTYVSDDPEELIPLTPSLFLQDVKEYGIPDLDFIDNTRLNKKLIYQQKLREDLRKRFRTEYLGQLRDYSKTKKKSSIKEGDIVLIGDNNVKRINWPLAKITKLYPGKDGRIRVVEVQSQCGSFLRPIQKLYPLEIPSDGSVTIPTVEDGVQRSQYGRKLIARQRSTL